MAAAGTSRRSAAMDSDVYELISVVVSQPHDNRSVSSSDTSSFTGSQGSLHSDRSSLYDESYSEDYLPYPGFMPVALHWFHQTTWPRTWCLRLITNPWFERVSMMVILLNCVTLGMYQPCVDEMCTTSRCRILQVFDHLIFAFFALEMMIKVLAMGFLGKGAYLAETWNRLDGFIVVAGALEYCLDVGNMNLSAIRTIRVLRPLRAINRIPSMRILVMLLLDTLPMLGNVLLLCFFVFFIFGIVGVQLWAGLLRQRCYLNLPADVHFPLHLSAQYVDEDGEDYICSTDKDNGMHKCENLPHYTYRGITCNSTADPINSNTPSNTSCVNWNQYYRNCRAGDKNPFQGAISFDNIGLAWVAIFLVISLEGWTDVMYYVQDAHSFWDWIYYVLLIVIGSFFMLNLCLVVIATQFSETKKREMERMRQERARYHSNSTLTSNSASEPLGCYTEMMKYLAHLGRRARRRFLRWYRMMRRKHRREEFPRSISLRKKQKHALWQPGQSSVKHEDSPGYVLKKRTSESLNLDSNSRGSTPEHTSSESPIAPCASPEISDIDPPSTPRRQTLLKVPSVYSPEVSSYSEEGNSDKTSGDTAVKQSQSSPKQVSVRLSRLPSNASGGSRRTSQLTCAELLALSGAQGAALAASFASNYAMQRFYSTLRKGRRHYSAPVLLYYSEDAANEDFTPTESEWSDLDSGSEEDSADERKAKHKMWLWCKPHQAKLKSFVNHRYFQRGILTAILVNTLSMGIEYHDQPEELTLAVEISNLVFTGIFGLEMVLKILAEGLFGYISNGFNVFDGIIVIISVVELCQSSGSGLSVLRTFRLLRIIKLVRFLPALRRQLVIMLRTMDNVAIFFSLLILFIFIFSCLGMHLFGGKFCDRVDGSGPCTCVELQDPSISCICDRKNFNSFLWATVTVFEILTQEDWNLVLFNGMEKTSHWAALYFVALMTFGNYVLFNLLVAILVEGFSAEDDRKKSNDKLEHDSQDNSSSKKHQMSESPKYKPKPPGAESVNYHIKGSRIQGKEPFQVSSSRNWNNFPRDAFFPPVITHTAATPQGSPCATGESSIRDFTNRLSPSVAYSISNSSLTSMDQSLRTCDFSGGRHSPCLDKHSVNYGQNKTGLSAPVSRRPFQLQRVRTSKKSQVLTSDSVLSRKLDYIQVIESSDLGQIPVALKPEDMQLLDTGEHRSHLSPKSPRNTDNQSIKLINMNNIVSSDPEKCTHSQSSLSAQKGYTEFTALPEHTGVCSSSLLEVLESQEHSSESPSDDTSVSSETLADGSSLTSEVQPRDASTSFGFLRYDSKISPDSASDSISLSSATITHCSSLSSESFAYASGLSFETLKYGSSMSSEILKNGGSQSSDTLKNANSLCSQTVEDGSSLSSDTLGHSNDLPFEYASMEERQDVSQEYLEHEDIGSTTDNIQKCFLGTADPTPIDPSEKPTVQTFLVSSEETGRDHGSCSSIGEQQDDQHLVDKKVSNDFQNGSDSDMEICLDLQNMSLLHTQSEIPNNHLQCNGRPPTLSFAPNNVQPVQIMSPQNSVKSISSPSQSFPPAVPFNVHAPCSRQVSLTSSVFSHNTLSPPNTFNGQNYIPSVSKSPLEAADQKEQKTSQIPESTVEKTDVDPSAEKYFNGKLCWLIEPQGWIKERESFSLFIFSKSNRFRQVCMTVADDKRFDYMILFFIALNCITLAMERPNIPPNSTERRILSAANYVFTAVFALEMFIKVVAKGLWYGKHAYFKNGWNIMDGILVSISIVDFMLSFIAHGSPRIFAILRVFRLLRSLRPLRVINRAPGLKLVVQTLLSSLRPIGNIVLICCTFFIIFGILGVQLFKGKLFYCDGPDVQGVKNKTECLADPMNQWINRKYNFDNLGQALMSLFVLASKDGWVEIMYTGLDAVDIDQQPVVNYSEWRLLYFISFLLLVAFFVLNMFVGVVVENFHRCREEQEKEEKARRAVKRARKLEKKRKKMREPPYYINYSKPRLFTHNIVTSKYFDLAIAAVIGLNVVTMAMEFYMMPLELVYALKIFNYFFTAVFILEAFMKVLALGIRRYLKDRWNQLDVVIVILSIVGIILEEMESEVIPINPTIIRVMRVLRIARVLKLLKMAKGIRALLDTVMQALPQVGNLGLLFFLLFFIFAALGVELFGRLECNKDFPCQGLGEHAHFRNFGMAFLTLFRVATGDNWNGIMKDTLRENCDSSSNCVTNCCVSPIIAPIYFVVFVLMAQFVLVNVVVAVLMKHLEESHTLMDEELEMEVEIQQELAAEARVAQEHGGTNGVKREKGSEKKTVEIIHHRPLVKMSSLPANFTFTFQGSVEDVSGNAPEICVVTPAAVTIEVTEALSDDTSSPSSQEEDPPLISNQVSLEPGLSHLSVEEYSLSCPDVNRSNSDDCKTLYASVLESSSDEPSTSAHFVHSPELPMETNGHSPKCSPPSSSVTKPRLRKSSLVEDEFASSVPCLPPKNLITQEVHSYDSSSSSDTEDANSLPIIEESPPVLVSTSSKENLNSKHFEKILKDDSSDIDHVDLS
ncbi:voltage-dependent T-type calcium channel subunit alpha-1G-like [Tachypleus tridentatus]|uniref:voltage-dependent T-type calcium channel subunit alpha-1G-like n=1 Tax=Tachypleus tridentatus TaxID=6853 RepID=UPI003FD2389A